MALISLSTGQLTKYHRRLDGGLAELNQRFLKHWRIGANIGPKSISVPTRLCRPEFDPEGPTAVTLGYQ